LPTSCLPLNPPKHDVKEAIILLDAVETGWGSPFSHIALPVCRSCPSSCQPDAMLPT
jgi:hypothetical protein